MSGYVRSWRKGRSFGWITDLDEREQYFVHERDVVGALPLRRGDRVSFVPTETARGPRATGVRLEPVRR